MTWKSNEREPRTSTAIDPCMTQAVTERVGSPIYRGIVKGRITQSNRKNSRFTVRVYSLAQWSLDQEHKHHLRTEKCKFSGPSPDLMNQTSWGWNPGNVCFNKPHGASDAYRNLGITGLVDTRNLMASHANHWESGVPTLVWAAGIEAWGTEGIVPQKNSWSCHKGHSLK